MNNTSQSIPLDPTIPIDSDFDSVPALIAGQVVQVPIEQLRPDPDQPRAEISEASLQSLAADIAIRGIELPIVVDDYFSIKDGERRWRAARIAGHTTVPCLLAPFATRGSTDWRLDQIADNHHREPLSALDWARVLNELVEKHGIKVKDLPELLERRGITMSRSYCSNLMRLSELPDWAQAHIRDGKLTAAHGKHILTAKDSPAVLEALRQHVTDRLASNPDFAESSPDALSTDELQRLVSVEFNLYHTRLDVQLGADAPRFDIATCEKCPNRKAIDGGYGERLFCLDHACFDQKQSAAPAKKKGTVSRSQTTGAPSSNKAQKEVLAKQRAESEIRNAAENAALEELFAKFAKSPTLLVQDVRVAALSLLQQYMGNRIESAICTAFTIKAGTHAGKSLRKRLDGASMSDATGIFLALLAADAQSNQYAFDDADSPFLLLCKAHDVDIEKLRKKARADDEPEKTVPEPPKKSAKKKAAPKPKASAKKKKARK